MLTVDGGPYTPDRAARALPFLLQDPVVHGIAISVLQAGGGDLSIAYRNGAPVAVGVCNEIKYLLSRSDDHDAPALLAADAVRRLGQLPGWMGPSPGIRGFTAAWERATGGGAAHLALAMRIYVLDRVPSAPPVPGRSRVAVPADRERLAGWRRAFTAETGAHGAGDDLAVIDRAVAEGSLHLWEDDGEAVSMAKTSGGPSAGTRIGLVYTPPELRRRGYASACVAALSARTLQRGQRYCYLYADLANPISNSIYQRIGYRPVADVEDWRPDAG